MLPTMNLVAGVFYRFALPTTGFQVRHYQTATFWSATDDTLVQKLLLDIVW